MNDRDFKKALQILGLDQGADEVRIITAHRRQRALYEADNLATYNLLSEEERQQLLRDLDWALAQLTRPAELNPQEKAPPQDTPPRPAAPRPAAPEGPEPDRNTQPGAFLRYRRQVKGLSRAEIAADTKISASRIASLEAEEATTLPAPVFVRGFIIAMATALGLEEPEDLARAYVQKLTQTR